MGRLSLKANFQACVVTAEGRVTTAEGCVATAEGCVVTVEGCVVTVEGCVVTVEGCVVTVEGCVALAVVGNAHPTNLAAAVLAQVDRLLTLNRYKGG
jgi:hypothetical protein